MSVIELGSHDDIVAKLGTQPGESTARCIQVAAGFLDEERVLVFFELGPHGDELELDDTGGELEGLRAQAYESQNLISVEGGSRRTDAFFQIAPVVKEHVDNELKKRFAS